MSIEDVKNRDLFMKLCFMMFVNNVLKVLGINEKLKISCPQN